MRVPAAIVALSLAALPAVGAAREAPFLRGNVSLDGRLDITEAIRVLRFLFAEVPQRLACLDAADVNDDGRVDVTDPIALLHYLFLHGPAPSPPFPQEDLDPTADDLGCDVLGDAFIYVVDRSGSMQDQGELGIAKREVGKNIQEFAATVLFAIIFVDIRVLAYPAGGKLSYAVPQARTEALAFVQNMPGGSGSCIKGGLLAALDLADQADAQRKVIVFFSDGGPACPGFDPVAYGQETLEAVTARNTGGVHINTIGVGLSVEEELLRQLAARNGGAYARVVQ